MIEECLVTEFRIRGDYCPLADASNAVDDEIEAAPPLLRDDGNVLLRFSVSSDTDLASVLDDDDRIRYLHQSKGDTRDTYRCLSCQPCVIHDLISAGFMVESLTYHGGDAVLTGAVVGHDVMRGVMATAGETVGVTLQREYTLRSADDESVSRRWDLTPAQEAGLRRALEMGYFAVPRETIAREVAADLGISKTAFLERLHRGLAALLTQVFSNDDTATTDD